MKNFTNIISSIFLIAAIAGCTGKAGTPGLLDRTGSHSDPERLRIESIYADAIQTLIKKPDDLQQYINLASAYIAEGRISGDNDYYNKAAFSVLDKIFSNTKPKPDILFQANLLKATILLNCHRFAEAREAAIQALAINDGNAAIYGVLIDAEVELGNYSKAVAYCDKMLAMRPDLRSYSRASYLRQIYGRNDAAIEAMIMAVDAGVAGNENTEWARTTLGDLYRVNGKHDLARATYEKSLVYRPDYPYALIGLARLSMLGEKYPKGIEYAEKAIGIIADPSFVSLLADLREKNGEPDKASEIRRQLLTLLKSGAKKDEGEPRHNSDRELAQACLAAGDIENALSYALKDLSGRPGNIDANALTAWIYFKKGDLPNARLYIDKSFITGIRSAEKFSMAAEIYRRIGSKEEGAKFAMLGNQINPFEKIQ